MLAESAVVGKGGLVAPVVATGSALTQGVGEAGLTDLRTPRGEALADALTDIIRELVDELETLHDVRDLKAGG